MEEYIEELKNWGIDINKCSESEKEIIKKYYDDGTPAKTCAKHLVFPY